MRATSTAVSITTHVIVVLAAVWSTTNPRPRVPETMTIVPLPPAPTGHTERSRDDGFPVPSIDGRVDLSKLTLPKVDGFNAAVERFVIGETPASGPLLAWTPGGDGTAIEASLVDELPMLLSGPVLIYPELLRQAGLQGRVVLEVVVDTLGRVERGSVVVVESAHPAFVAPAQQSLLKSLFRPARIRGKAVRVRVRVPIDFVLRGSTSLR